MTKPAPGALAVTPGHIQFNGVVRAGVRFDAGAVDDSLVTIGTWPIEQLGGPAETAQSFIGRLMSNTYQMVASEVVSVEFPSNATDGLGMV